MGRLTRLLDSGLELLEEAIERISDRERIRTLQDALCRMNRRLLGLLDENEALNQRLLQADSIDQSRLKHIADLQELLQQLRCPRHTSEVEGVSR